MKTKQTEGVFGRDVNGPGDAHYPAGMTALRNDKRGGLYGYRWRNGSKAYISRKRALINELHLDGLKILRENPHSDFHAVFDGSIYVEDEAIVGLPKPYPIVFIHLYPSDGALIAARLGFPIINLAANRLK